MVCINQLYSVNSQFFICFDDVGFLDNQYIVWGQVMDGMDVIDQLVKGELLCNLDFIVFMKVVVDS